MIDLIFELNHNQNTINLLDKWLIRMANEENILEKYTQEKHNTTHIHISFYLNMLFFLNARNKWKQKNKSIFVHRHKPKNKTKSTKAWHTHATHHYYMTQLTTTTTNLHNILYCKLHTYYQLPTPIPRLFRFFDVPQDMMVKKRFWYDNYQSVHYTLNYI